MNVALDRQGHARPGWQLRWDRQTRAFGLWHPALRVWVGYDDARAVHEKAAWARKAGLAGTFAWELTQDGGDLLRAMNLGGGHQLVPPASAHKARGQVIR
jgi:chitinase